jgi:hypothetical protein
MAGAVSGAEELRGSSANGDGVEPQALSKFEAAPSRAAAVGVVTEEVRGLKGSLDPQWQFSTIISLRPVVVTEEVGPTMMVVQLIGTRAGGTIESAVRGGSFSAGALRGPSAVSSANGDGFEQHAIRVSSANGDGFEQHAGASSSGSARGSAAVAGGSSATGLIESDRCVVAGGGGAPPQCKPDLTTEAQAPLDGAAVGTKSGPQRICRCCFD